MSVYESIELTEEETKDAILEGKKKKYFYLKSKDYWIEQEQKAIENHEEEKRLNRIKSKIKPSSSPESKAPIPAAN